MWVHSPAGASPITPEVEEDYFAAIVAELELHAIEVITKDGRTLELWADENYRGSPHNPLTDEEVEGKLRDCAEGLLDEAQIKAVINRVWHLEDQASVTDVLADLHWQKG